jgi:hypothetical protein
VKSLVISLVFAFYDRLCEQAVLNSVLLWSPYGLRDRRLALVARRPGRFLCVLTISIDLFFSTHKKPLSDF